MAFVRSDLRSGDKTGRTGSALRWIAISGAGAGLALLSLSGVAGLVLLATSLTSPSDFTGQTATPNRLALATTLYSSPHRQGCANGCGQRAQYIVQQAKSPRKTHAVDAQLKIAEIIAPTTKQRFDKAQAVLNHDKMAAALAHSQTQLAELAPVKDRFYPASTNRSGPVPARFGPQVAEIERSSRLALALAGAGEIQIAYTPVAAAVIVPSMPLMAELDVAAPVEMAEAAVFEIAPDSVPLPAHRPQLSNAPAAVAEAAFPPAPKPARRTAAQQQALAYAAPGDDAPSVGQAFKNLFSSSKAGNGVAVYDISAQTVTMPDGQTLEAHSGIGHMADDPRYVAQKMSGPTPPNTYKLVMRESRFHGVEAIRMLPVDGKNKFGRNGLLTHSYLLRNGRAESHGCVAFANYDRFLKAFKQGKITHMIVVPGRGRAAPRVASNGRRT